MKIIYMGGGIILIILSLIISFGIIVSSLKERDEDIFKYLLLPGFMLSIGIYLIIRSKKIHNS